MLLLDSGVKLKQKRVCIGGKLRTTVSQAQHYKKCTQNPNLDHNSGFLHTHIKPFPTLDTPSFTLIYMCMFKAYPVARQKKKGCPDSASKPHANRPPSFLFSSYSVRAQSLRLSGSVGRSEQPIILPWFEH